MTRMTRDQANQVLMQGVQADLEATAAILLLLERQFEAAVRHRSAELAGLAAEIEPALEAMEARRVQRVSLVRALVGLDSTRANLIASRPEPMRTRLASDWAELEQRVRACKEATSRNSNFLAEQYSVMQRVLHGEDEIYAPR